MHQQIFKKALSSNVYYLAIETVLSEAAKLSLKIENSVFLKREDLQVSNSFKVRGACSKIFSESISCDDVIVVAFTGNHAQSFGLAAKKRKLKSIAVVPKNTPQKKIDDISELYSEIILYGCTWDETITYAKGIAELNGYKYMLCCDDLDVISGQATVAKEILQQLQLGVDAIFIPVGSGSLLMGMAVYTKYLSPDTQVIGVQWEEASNLENSFARDEYYSQAEGSNNKYGSLSSKYKDVLVQSVDHVITVKLDEVCSAIRYIYDDTKSLVEMFGAVATAGMIKYTNQYGIVGKKLVCVCSGGNADFQSLGAIVERAE